MNKQIHKKFSNEFVKSILEKYLNSTLSLNHALSILQIKKTRFFQLLNIFKSNPSNFSISYKINYPTNKLDKKSQKIIFEELKKEKNLIIDDVNVPTNNYNYSYIKNLIENKYDLKVSLPTIIKIAKQNNFYIPRKKNIKHTSEVITNYTGELIQHDSSYHKFSPYTEKKWYLITSLDDYSRYILYAKLIEKRMYGSVF